MTDAKKTATKVVAAGVALVACLMTILGSQQVLAHGWKAPEIAASKKNPVKMTGGSIDAGRALYGEFCARCHGKAADGNGSTAGELATRPPDLKKRLAGHSDGDFFWKIQTGKGEMPGFNEDLEDRDIWNVINYIRSLMP